MALFLQRKARWVIGKRQVKIPRLVIKFVLATVALLGMSPASALTNISGLVFFDSFTFVSAHTAPQVAAFFSFDLDDTLAPDTGGPGDGYNVDQIYNFVYELDGVDVPEALLAVAFYAEPDGGLFSLTFASQTLDFYGNDIGSTGVLTHGFFTASEVYDPTDPSGDGVAFIAVGVPEPASWALMIVGFGLTGAMLRRETRRLA